MQLDESILQHYGGFDNNSLNSRFNTDDDEENSQINMIKHSPYHDDKSFIDLLANNNKRFSVLSTNIESIFAKFTELEIFVEYLEQNDFHFSAICLQECWLASDQDISQIQLKGYQCIYQGKTCGRKGGLMIYLHEDFKYRVKQLSEHSHIWESQYVEVYGGGLKKSILIGNIYRPPRNLNIHYRTFIEELTPILASFDKNNSEIILTGDFNINLLDINLKEIYSEIFDTFLSNSFYPKITLPTRFSNRKGTLLDNFFCKLSETTLNSTSGILVKQFSDHHPYFIFLDTLNKYQPNSRKIKISKQSQESVNSFISEIKNANITGKIDCDPLSCPSKNYDVVEQIINDAYTTHLPCKFVKFKKHKHKKNTWITQGIIRSIKFRDTLYKNLKSKLPGTEEFNHHKINLNTYNNILKRSIREAKKLYYESCFDRYKTDIRKTWSTINDILNKTKKKKDFPEFFKDGNILINDRLTIANKFNVFFTNIGPNLASEINTPNHKHFKDYLNSPPKCTFQFQLIDETLTESLFDKLPNKSSSGYDNISLKLLKRLKTDLVSPITILVNQMLSTGVFPEKLKLAKVIPLYKKDEDSQFNNYRPISLLPAISKIFEKVIFIQLFSYFDCNKLFYNSQYGFRTGHSTELAVLEIIDRLVLEMDKGELPFNIYLDLSKAFDTLDHTILLQKLDYYGVKDLANNLFRSYLTDRTQFVEFKDIKSDILTLSTGVPQGSILGPLLFIIYMNDISKVSDLFQFIIYADDTTLLSILKPFSADASVNVNENINYEIGKISDWLKVNRLSLNVKKTKFMVFHHPSKQIQIPRISIENNEVECVDNFTLLGITLDKNLNWKQHIGLVSSKISRTIGILNKLKHFLPFNIKLTIYNSLVSSYINYGILAWGHHCDRLVKLQKKAIRIINLSKYNAHTDPLFKKSRLLKANDTFNLFQFKFFYKFVHQQLPDYFLNMPFLSNAELTNHRYFTRQHDYLSVSKCKHEFAKHCIRYSIPKLLNGSPPIIKDKLYTHSYNGFSNYVKKKYYESYNDTCNLQNCYICQNL